MEKVSKFKIFFFLSVFFIFYFLFLITHYANNLSLFFDIPSMFFLTIFDFDNIEKHYFMYKAFDNVRLFSNFLLVIPFNIFGIHYANNSILALSNNFSLSYLIMHFIAIILNFIVARRTKRYDIATIAFAFYCIFSLPNIIWAVREVHFAALMYFPLLSYFLSYTKLTKRDWIPICLLLVYLFESFEITSVLGVMLFFFANKYSKKGTDQNIWYKVFIGFISLFAAIYIPAKILYFMSKKELVFTEGFGLQEWINGSLIALSNMFNSNLIIFIFALIGIIFTVLWKKEYNIKILLLSVPFFALLCDILYSQTGFYPSIHREMHNYSLAFWFIYPTILTIILLDYYNVVIKKYFTINLLIIACIFGSINLAWQINSNIEFGKYTNALKEIVNTSSEIIVEIPQEQYKNTRYINACNTCFSTTPASVIISDKKKVEKIIVPSDYFYDYSQWCFDDKNYTHYDTHYDILRLQTAMLKPQSSLLDVTSIIDEFKKENLIKN